MIARDDWPGKDDLAAWITADFATADEWKQAYPSEVEEELARAIPNLVGDLETVGAQRISSLKLKETLEFVRTLEAEIMDGRGFVLVRGLNPELSDQMLRARYWILGILLGTPLSQNSFGELLSEVTDLGLPIRSAQGMGFVRGYETNAQLSFHTDRADIVGLLCVQPAKSGGLSNLASAISIHNELKITHPELLDALYHGTPCIDVEEGGDQRVTYMPVFSVAEGVVSCRYTRGHMQTAIVNGVKFSEIELAAIEAMDALARSSRFRLDMQLQRGDIQLINNHTTLHSRTEFEDHNDPRLKRRLSRLWLRGNRSRPLADCFELYDGVPATLPPRREQILL